MHITADAFVSDMNSEERERVGRVEPLLHEIREKSLGADQNASFPQTHVALFKESGLLGLMVPKEYGGLGGGLRDLAAVTFSLGTACPSTALTYFFHCSTSSRGLLALDAIEAGLFNNDEGKKVRSFAEKVLGRMGAEGLWFSNFASESVKSQKAAVTVNTEAKPVEGGYELSGSKSFGCGTGVSDYYLVTGKMEGSENADGLATFFVKPDSKGVSERHKWDAIGMRGSATHGINLDKVFIPEDEALVVPGSFTKMMKMSRGSFVGNQIAGTACYLGAAHNLYKETLDNLSQKSFADTGKPISDTPFIQEIIGKMARDLSTATLWMRHQLHLETQDHNLPKDQVIAQWRICKGEVSEKCFRIAESALKVSGTSGTGNTGIVARSLRDLSMGLVQAFPPERGRIEAARTILNQNTQDLFGIRK